MKEAMATQDELQAQLNMEENREQDVLAQTEQAELDIMSLGAHAGWHALVGELQEEMDTLDREILDIDSDISSEELEKKRIRRFYLKRMIDMPQEKADIFNSRKGYESQGDPVTETL